MMTFFRSYFLIVLLIQSLSPSAWGLEQKSYEDLFIRQELLHRSYRETYTTLTDIEKYEALSMWFRLLRQSPEHRLILGQGLDSLRPYLQGQDYRQLLLYYTLTGQIPQAAQVVGLYLLSAHTLIDNVLNDPQARAWRPEVIDRLAWKHRPLQRQDLHDIENCWRGALRDFGVTRQFSPTHVDALEEASWRCLRSHELLSFLNRKLDYLFRDKGYRGAPFPVSFAGFVPGNRVHLHPFTPISELSILTLGEQLNRILTQPTPLGGPYANWTVTDFKEAMPTPETALNQLFTTEEGYLNLVEGTGLQQAPHPSFGLAENGKLGIYGQITQSIRAAKQSVFIDIFWMGGSIGMNLAKELFRKVIENPEFQVFIITDQRNKFQYGPELDAIYHYMRAFSEKFPQLNFYITPAQVDLKRTALPEFIDLLITNSVVQSVQADANIKALLEKDGFHLLARSDHSKVLIVDGTDPVDGIAFVGSKNWTDSSGGVNFDEVAEVQGPAVPLILNSFYYDLFEAFLLDLHPLRGGEMVRAHLKEKAPSLAERAGVQKLLAPVDILHRWRGGEFEIVYQPIGPDTVAPAQNNIYGTEVSPIEQNIQMISQAQRQILIDDQFFFDQDIVEALKVARLERGVEIYLILESLLPNTRGEGGLPAHLPNNLFIPELVDMGVQVKWHLTPSSVLYAILEDSHRHPQQSLTATFHVKSMSVDGVLYEDRETCQQNETKLSPQGAPAVISGSANKDVLTMSGGFREYQIASYSKGPVIEHNCLFWKRWDDPEETQTTDGLDFNLPPQLTELGVQDKRQFLNLVQQILFTPYRFRKDFL